MKIIHTSDWHIGRALYGCKRYEEFEAFLAWLGEFIVKDHVDVLLVAGDIFDNSTPSNRAQELYYHFLYRVANSSCRHVVITAGNHDSPSFLNAPKEVLRFLNVHVVGSVSDSPKDDVLVLSGQNGKPELIVCAVPYLRDCDIRKAEAGESMEDKERKMVEGIRSHYRNVCLEAEKIQQEMERPVPIVAMGHIFTAGGRTVDGDGVRELYVGSLAHVGNDVFPECIDYLALGHLHIPQKVGNSETRRYSGSPLPMGFGEANQEKMVLKVEFSGTEPGTQPVVTGIPVPVFQALESIRGDWGTITRRLEELKNDGSSACVEIVYDGDEVATNLTERLDSVIEGSGIKILRTWNNRNKERAMSGMECEETLDDLSINDVFMRCLDTHDVPEEQRSRLLQTYEEAVASLHEEDVRAE
ncbi:MAG: exonuclease SbcCD subunit D C-terminal domain-containing protein [Nitrospirota bacterium]